MIYRILTIVFISLSLQAEGQWNSSVVQPYNIRVVSFAPLDSSKVWAYTQTAIFGSPVRSIYKTKDGGFSWFQVPFTEPNMQSHQTLFIHPFDSSNVLLGFIDASDYATGLYFRTTNGGATWTKLLYNNSPWPTNWAALGYAALSPTKGWLFGSSLNFGLSRMRIYETQNKGDYWSEITIPDSIAQFGILSFGDGVNTFQKQGNQIFIGGRKSRIYHYNLLTTQWKIFNLNLEGNKSFNSIAFQDSLRGMALSSTVFEEGFTQSILAKTTNGGTTWKVDTLADTLPASVISQKQGRFYLHNSENSYHFYGIAYSDDFGSSWKYSSTHKTSALKMLDTSKGWSCQVIGGVNKLYYYGKSKITSIDSEKSNNDIQIYPNPTKSYLEYDVSGKFDFVLSDLTGKIWNQGILEGKNQFNTAFYKSGVYVLKLFRSNQQEKVLKIIIQ